MLDLNTNIQIIEREVAIFNVQKYNMHDGPGVRTLVFFQGCPLRCKWCSNPEGLEKNCQVMFKQKLCIDCGACISVCPVEIHSIGKIDNKHSIDRNITCVGCRKCMDVCISSALSIVGEKKRISELYEIIEEDKKFYELSGGGVTLGGGEVLMQSEAAANLLMVCKQEGINTAVETCGYARLNSLLKVAEFTDLFLFDLKHTDSQRHFELTGVHNELILQNLEELIHRRYDVKIRIPLLKGINDSKKEINEIVNLLLPYRNYKNFKGIDLLPYHKLGVNKYKQLGLEYKIKEDLSLNVDELKRIENYITKYDISINIIRH